MGIQIKRQKECKALCFIWGLLLMGVLLPSGLLAQPSLKEIVEQNPKDEATVAAKEEGGKDTSKLKGPQDEFDRGVPRTSVAGFLAAAKERDFERAAEYLDLRNLPRGLSVSQGPSLASEAPHPSEDHHRQVPEHRLPRSPLRSKRSATQPCNANRSPYHRYVSSTLELRALQCLVHQGFGPIPPGRDRHQKSAGCVLRSADQHSM